MYPRLKATIALAPSGTDALVCLRLGLRAYEISMTEGEPESFLNLMGLLNGAFSVEKIATLLDLPTACLRSTLEQLVSVGLVYDYRGSLATEEISQEDFLSSVTALTSAFRFDMFRHPLFAQLAEREKLFLATAIEYGHIIRDASTHIEKALSHAPAHLEDLLKNYLASEADHYLDLQTSLSAALSMEFRFDDVEPLAATEALLLKTHDLAISDPLAYIACCAAFEAERVPSSTDLLQWTSNTAADVYRVLRDHAAEDCSSSHSTLFQQAIASMDVVDANTVVRVCNALHTYKHYFDNLNFEILRAYSCDNAGLPRLKPKLADFFIAQ